MTNVLRYEVTAGIAVMTLDRPARKNAIDAELGQAINDALVRVAADKTVRALIVTGANGAFSAGGDAGHISDTVVVERPQSQSPDEPEAVFVDVLPQTPPHLRSRYTFARALPIPTFAAIDGVAIGAGLVLAMSCDFRFGSPRASFSAVFPRIGMVAELGLAWSLTNTIGGGPATDMLLSGRRVDAEEALRWGLITKIYPQASLLDDCIAFASDVTGRCSPRALRQIKKMIAAVPTQSYAEAYEMARLEARAAIASADFTEGVAALREKRAPVWPTE